jgi:hypothetical protein
MVGGFRCAACPFPIGSRPGHLNRCSNDTRQVLKELSEWMETSCRSIAVLRSNTWTHLRGPEFHKAGLFTDSFREILDQTPRPAGGWPQSGKAARKFRMRRNMLVTAASNHLKQGSAPRPRAGAGAFNWAFGIRHLKLGIGMILRCWLVILNKGDSR